MSDTITYPAGTAADGGKLRIGRISRLADSPTTEQRWRASAPPNPPPPPSDPPRRGRGDDDKPSRREQLARQLLALADGLLLIAFVLLMIERHRR